MANTVTKTIISEGTQKMVVHFYFESDGNEGELNNYPLFSPADCQAPWIPQINTNVSPPDGRVKQFTILQAWCSAAWFDLILSFDGATPAPGVVIARDADFYMGFCDFGGIKDRTVDAPTGTILVTTRDFAPLGSAGFLVFELKKN